MSMPGIKWGNIQRYLKQHDFSLNYRGGDLIVVAPKGYPCQKKNTIKIGHRHYASSGTQVSPVVVKHLELAFGITRTDLESY